MNYKTTGIVVKICDIRTTKTGVAVQQIHFEEQDRMHCPIFPSALGTKIELLADFLPGDVAEIEFHISGNRKDESMYNNIIIDNITRI